jgi:hypothetical protein
MIRTLDVPSGLIQIVPVPLFGPPLAGVLVHPDVANSASSSDFPTPLVTRFKTSLALKQDRRGAATPGTTSTVPRTSARSPTRTPTRKSVPCTAPPIPSSQRAASSSGRSLTRRRPRKVDQPRQRQEGRHPDHQAAQHVARGGQPGRGALPMRAPRPATAAPASSATTATSAAVGVPPHPGAPPYGGEQHRRGRGALATGTRYDAAAHPRIAPAAPACSPHRAASLPTSPGYTDVR